MYRHRRLDPVSVLSMKYRLGIVLTFFEALIGSNDEVEISAIAERTFQNDFTFKFENGDASSVELHTSGLLVRLELEED